LLSSAEAGLYVHLKYCREEKKYAQQSKQREREKKKKKISAEKKPPHTKRKKLVVQQQQRREKHNRAESRERVSHCSSGGLWLSLMVVVDEPAVFRRVF